jgi:hypothetical protein
LLTIKKKSVAIESSQQNELASDYAKAGTHYARRRRCDEMKLKKEGKKHADAVPMQGTQIPLLTKQ